MIESMAKASKKERNVEQIEYRCPSCKVVLNENLYYFNEKTKCKKCKNHFFFVKIPSKFFVLFK